MMAKARVLKMEETVQHGRVVWLELRETDGVIPVAFWAEHMPFLKYDAQDRVAMIEVRAEYYGKTWRCWDQDPAGAQSMKPWKSAGGPIGWTDAAAAEAGAEPGDRGDAEDRKHGEA